MSKPSKDVLIIIASTILLTLLVWIPHMLRLENFFGLNFPEGFNTIYRNFDGIEYITIAKSFYFPSEITKLPQSLSANYYAAHFPLYSLLILLFSPVLGFLKSMLFVSLVSTIGATVAFYFLVRDFKLSSKPLTLALLFLILPARWLIVHSVGSSEPTFIIFVILSLYFFMKFESSNFVHLKLKEPLKNKMLYIHLAGLFGLLAQLTRSPGILLFIAYGLYILWKNKSVIVRIRQLAETKQSLIIIKQYHPLLLMPLGLLATFYWYSLSYNDFFAYFHSGDNIHLTLPPFQVFNKDQFWVGNIWLEDIIYIFILGFLSVTYLFKQKLYPLAFFVLTYLTASTLIAHRDISRYVLPISPFMLIAFEKVLTSKEFKIVMIIVALAIYLYTQNFLLSNTAPIPNLEVFN